MTDELKEGDEVVLRGRVTEISVDEFFTTVEVCLENGRFLLLPPCFVHKVRPGTYEVTARDVVDICEGFLSVCYNSNGFSDDDKRLRWCKNRLRELRRKRGGR